MKSWVTHYASAVSCAVMSTHQTYSWLIPQEDAPEAFGGAPSNPFATTNAFLTELTDVRAKRVQEFLVPFRYTISSFGSPAGNLLSALVGLKDNWDGYDSPAPSRMALQTAAVIDTVLSEISIVPDRVAASVVGGVGITIVGDSGELYIECSNSGACTAAVSLDDGTCRAMAVDPTRATLVELATEIGLLAL